MTQRSPIPWTPISRTLPDAHAKREFGFRAALSNIVEHWNQADGVGSRIYFTELMKWVWRTSEERDCLDLAAQMSFYFVLALFPFLIFLAALVGYLPFTDLWDNVLTWLTNYFPREPRRLIIQTVLSLRNGRTSFLSLGLLGTAWAACSGVLSLMRCLNVAYGVKETRSYWKRLSLAFVTLFALSFLVLASFGLFTTGTWLGQRMSAWLKPGFVFSTLWWVAKWIISLALLSLGVAIADHVLPNIKRRWRWVTPGSLFVALAWAFASAGFDLYITYIASYGRIYGTLGAFVMLLVWIYITSLITLVGAEMNYKWEKSRSLQP